MRGFQISHFYAQYALFALNLFKLKEKEFSEELKINLCIIGLLNLITCIFTYLTLFDKVSITVMKCKNPMVYSCVVMIFQVVLGSFFVWWTPDFFFKNRVFFFTPFFVCLHMTTGTTVLKSGVEYKDWIFAPILISVCTFGEFFCLGSQEIKHLIIVWANLLMFACVDLYSMFTYGIDSLEMYTCTREEMMRRKRIDERDAGRIRREMERAQRGKKNKKNRR